jgi:hypothetical protein
MEIPPAPPFCLPVNRSRITREPDELGKWTAQFPDMMGSRQYGGGSVPEGYPWPSNPKEWQEELSNTELVREARVNGALGAAGELPAPIPAAVAALPSGGPPER